MNKPIIRKRVSKEFK